MHTFICICESNIVTSIYNILTLIILNTAYYDLYIMILYIIRYVIY